MRYALAIACALIATPAAAEQLLFEMYHGNNWLQFGTGDLPPANPIQTFISIGRLPNYGSAEWVFYAEPSHVGQTFAAPDLFIYHLNAAIPKGNGFIRSYIGFDGPYTDLGQTVMMGGPSPGEGFSLKTFYAPRGPGLIGYRVTRAEMRVDAVEMNYPDGPNRFLYRNAAGTFRVYGEPVPEPATWLLLTIAGVAWRSRRRK